MDDYIVERSAEHDFGQSTLDEDVAEACDALGLCPDLAARWHALPPVPNDHEDDGDKPSPAAPDTS